jgi:hypothetical protein
MRQACGHFPQDHHAILPPEFVVLHFEFILERRDYPLQRVLVPFHSLKHMEELVALLKQQFHIDFFIARRRRQGNTLLFFIARRRRQGNTLL